jgi:tricorn protease
MNRSFLFLLVLGLIASAHPQSLTGARFPALSPDGRQIAFSYMGDLWIVSSQGGRATPLTNNTAYEREPIWTPDGRSIVFSSDRNGNYDVFVIPASGGDARQLTFHSGADIASDVTPDGRTVLFRSTRASRAGLYRIPLAGGNEIPILNTYWAWSFNAKVSPDGGSVVFSLGLENRFWWRKGYRGSNSAKIYTMPLDSVEPQQIVSDTTNSFWPSWRQDGKAIYFVSERDRQVGNIWIQEMAAPARPLTHFDAGYITWMSMAREVPLAVYERNFAIWLTDLDSGRSWAVPITAPSEAKDNPRFFAENDKISEFRLSPDGKKLAAIVRGEIFISGSGGEYTRNVSNSPWRERDLDWDPASQNIVYVSDAEAQPDLYLASALGDEPAKRLTNDAEDQLNPHFSPDGQWLAYYSGSRQLRLMDAHGKNDRLLAEADFGGRFADDFIWSPDSRFIAVTVNRNGNADLVALDRESGEMINLTNTAYEEGHPVWSHDGQFMLFTSNRSGHSFPEFTGDSDIYQLHLQPKRPEFAEDSFEKLFAAQSDTGKARKRPPQIRFNLDDLDRQTEIVASTARDESDFALSPKDTSSIYFASNLDGKNHLWKTSLKTRNRGKYEAYVPAVENPRQLQIDAKGKYLYYLSEGKIGRIDLDAAKSEPIPFSTKIEVNKTADYAQGLGELYYTLQHYYYDEHHHQVDWTGIYRDYLPVLQQVRQDQDFYDFANLMIGQLNSSHTGMNSPPPPKTADPSAHVGAVWQFAGKEVRLERLIKNGPLYSHRDSLAAGDQLVSVNGTPVSAEINLWKIFNGLLEKRVKLSFQKSDGKSVTVAIKPISMDEEISLLLEEWIAGRKEWVKKRSDDQLAYLYMPAMGYTDLQRFLKEVERDAVPRKGLILDIRYNFGGNVHDRVLQALTKPLYARWRIRGLSGTPQSTFALSDKSVALLINETTLSDGEMTANGFKTLRRGPVIGEPTYGWLIFTTTVSLMNGATFGLPFWGCYTLDGRDLETSGGVIPDILIRQDLRDDLQNRDPQLDRAIEELMKEIKRN